MTEIPQTDTPPSVSIVLPTYNRAHVLPLAIQSVLEQEFTDFELIIVNDNASDNTEEVVESFPDPRIRYYRNDPNLKLPRTLNRGFSLARGRYLTWTSDDNMFDPRSIGTMVEELEKGDADFVFADYQEFADTDPEGHPIGGRAVKLPGRPDMAAGNSIGACFMYTREVYDAIGEYDPDLFLNEDYDYWMRIARKFRMKHIPQSLYYFRRNEESLYCSRFAEVRAGSLLVRYKNEFLDQNQVLDGLVDLVASNLDRLKNPFFRTSLLAIKNSSYRLTRLYESFLRKKTHRQLARLCQSAIREFNDGNKTFNDTRIELSQLVGTIADIQYRSNAR